MFRQHLFIYCHFFPKIVLHSLHNFIKSYCTLSNSYCTLCAPKHTILGPDVYSIRGITLDWFRDYLRNRQQFVTLTDISSDMGNITCGVPQGSVFGPLLFLLYINDIQNCISDCSIKLFADYTNVFVHGKSLDEVIAKANNSLASLSKWFTANKLIKLVLTKPHCFGEDR